MIRTHYIQSGIFQAFICDHFDDFYLQLVKTQNLKFQRDPEPLNGLSDSFIRTPNHGEDCLGRKSLTLSIKRESLKRLLLQINIYLQSKLDVPKCYIKDINRKLLGSEEV